MGCEAVIVFMVHVKRCRLLHGISRVRGTPPEISSTWPSCPVFNGTRRVGLFDRIDSKIEIVCAIDCNLFPSPRRIDARPLACHSRAWGELGDPMRKNR